MRDDYSTYTNKELLEDHYFISSMIEPTPESELFWESLVADGLIRSEEFEQAKKFIQIMKSPQKIMTAKERTQLWIKIEIQNKKILQNKLRRRKAYFYGTAASLLCVIFFLGFFLAFPKEEIRADFHDVMSKLQTVDEETKEIQLVLSDSKTIELDEKTADIVLQQDGEIIVNSKKLEEKAEQTENDTDATYNQLFIPFGRHSSLTLSDGTKMHINSGTKVVFPHKFRGKEREIFVNGEVYLEVAQNKKVPFIVHTDKMDVKVLGTSLNVRAYEQDESHAVVLATGSVLVTTNDKHEAQLLPDQMFDYSNGESSITSVNAYDYISWKDGYFIYRKESLQKIMKQLSRYYGTEIVCSPEIASVTCSGKLDLKEELDKVMGDLSGILQVKILFKDNTYEVKKNINH